MLPYVGVNCRYVYHAAVHHLVGNHWGCREMQSLFIVLLSLLVFVASGLPIWGQTGDIRLSPPNPTVAVLPVDVRIESSASREDRTLVVLGGAYLGANRTIVPALYVELFRDTTSQSPPVLLTSEQARPSKAVAVVPLRQYFLVFWNDVRADSPGVYIRRTDSIGKPLDGEYRISSHGLLLDSLHHIRIVGDTLHGCLVVWNAVLGNGSLKTMSARFDTDGQLDVNYGERGPGNFDLLTYPVLNRTTLLHMPSYRCDLVDSSGRIVDSTIDSGPFDASHVVLDDSTLIYTTGNLLTYRGNITHQVVDGSVRIDALDSAEGGKGILTQGANRGVYVYYLHFESTGDNLQPGIFRTSIYRVFVDTLRNISLPLRVYQDSTPNGLVKPWVITRKVESLRVIPGSSNSALFELVLERSTSYSGGDVTVSKDQFRYSFADSNVVPNSGLFIDPGPGTQPRIVVRFLSDSMSRVTVTIRSTVIDVTAPVARLDTNIGELHPGIVLRGGKLRVGWSTGGSAMSASAVEWNPSVGAPEDSVNVWHNHTIPVCLPETSGAISYNGGPQFDSSVSFQVFDNFYGIIAAPWHEQRWRVDFSPRSYSLMTTEATALHATLPVDSGWAGAVNDYDCWNNYYESHKRHLVSGVAWNARAGLLAIYSVDRAVLFRIVVDSTGHRVHSRVDSVTGWKPGTRLIVLDSTDYIFAQDSIFIRYRNSSPIDSFPVSGTRRTMSVHSLMRSEVLRVALDDSVSGTIALEFYRADGLLLAERLIAPAVGVASVFVTQNQLDSTIAVIWGGSNGVRGAFFRQNDLALLAADTLLSETQGLVNAPAGIFLHDTLFLVWEDHRGTNGDIYGRVWTIPQAWKRTSGIDEKAQYTRIIPNPAHDRVTVSGILATQEAVWVDVVDLNGNVVLRQRSEPTGSTSYTLNIDVKSLPSGLYTLHVRNEHSSLNSSIVIVR